MNSIRIGILTVVVMWCSATVGNAQTTYTWNDTSTDWGTGSNWSPNGTPGGNAGDIAQFVFPTTGTVNNPNLTSAQTFRQLNFGSAPSAGWSLTGSGSLTLSGTGGVAGATSLSQAGLVTRAGGGAFSINLGNGTATSLTFAGSTGGPGGALQVSNGSTLTFTGNTVAATSGAALTSIRGGTLVLDNSAGNPTSQRFTTANAISLNGGGSTLELRSATGGSTFSGMTGALTTGSGGSALRINQASASGQLSVTFGSLVRGNTGSGINFQNVGAGTLGGVGVNDPRVLFTTAPTLANGVIGNTATTPGFAIYNGTDFAGYDVTRGVIAVSTTNGSGSLVTGPTVNLNLNGTASGTGSISYNTVKISPGAAGQALTLSTSSDRLSTAGLLLGGTTDYSINGAGQWLVGAGGRFAWVTNPNTALNLSVTLGAQEMTKLGDGFMILTGITNQAPQTTANVPSLQNVNLGGGVFRVTTTNFNFAPRPAQAPRSVSAGGSSNTT